MENQMLLCFGALHKVNDLHSSQGHAQSCEDQKTQIIQTAAKRIKNDVKSIIRCAVCFPKYNEMASASSSSSSSSSFKLVVQ